MTRVVYWKNICSYRVALRKKAVFVWLISQQSSGRMRPGIPSQVVPKYRQAVTTVMQKHSLNVFEAFRDTHTNRALIYDFGLLD